jgi:hypothetical protein
MTKVKNLVYAGVLAVCVTGAYFAGKKTGTTEGVLATSKAYDFWAQSFMYRDPLVRLDAVLLVPDGAKISQPACRADEEGFMRLARRPDATLNNDADASKIPGYWVARIPQSKSTLQPLGAALVGCRKLAGAPPVRDLTNSWEFPSTMN